MSAIDRPNLSCAATRRRNIRVVIIIITSHGLNARWRSMPALPTSASCFGPVLSGSVPADFHHTTPQYRLSTLRVGGLSCSCRPSTQRAVSLVSCRRTFGIRVQKAVASFQSPFAVGCVSGRFSHTTAWESARWKLLTWRQRLCTSLRLVNKHDS